MAQRQIRRKRVGEKLPTKKPRLVSARNRGTLPAMKALIDKGVLTQKAATALLADAANDKRDLAEVIRERHPRIALSSAFDYPFVDLLELRIDPAAVAAVPEALARRHGVLPFGFDGDRLIIAIADAIDVIAVDDLAMASGREIAIVLAEPGSIEDAWMRLDVLDTSTETMLTEATNEAEDEEEFEFDASSDAPVVRAINQLIVQAVHQHASDLHIEPQEDDVRVRFRLDGVLKEIMHAPRRFNNGITSRLKIMANMDIAERRIPQDGRMTVTVDNQPVDLRIATVPSVWGEEVILRILDRSSSLLTLTELGFLPDTLRRYEQAITKPHGAILVVGPTGSGKSTTLYSTLSVINEPTRKIITVEDPVEFRLKGTSQIHVNQKAGLSFASALRSILRSDPDVVMVGEIRDTETARIAIEAAMTGHLVFSTLHTSDAPSAITRLIEMQVEPFLVATSIQCVLAQRLARKLCLRCREQYAPTATVLTELGLPKRTRMFHAVGCTECSGTGYRGRVAIVELMMMSEEIERLAADRKSSEEIRRVAVAQGMRSLREDGLEKACMGTTSLEEVLRVVEGTPMPALAAAEPVLLDSYSMGNYAVD